MLHDIFQTLTSNPAPGIHWFWVVAWFSIVAVLFVTLLLLVATRWGRHQPLRICVVLSVLAHVLMAGYAATIRIASHGHGPAAPVFEVSFSDELAAQQNEQQSTKPWEELPSTTLDKLEQLELKRQEADADGPTSVKLLASRQPVDTQDGSVQPQWQISDNAVNATRPAAETKISDAPRAQRAPSDSESLPADVEPARPQPDDFSDDAKIRQSPIRRPVRSTQQLSRDMDAIHQSLTGNNDLKMARATPLGPAVLQV